MFVFFFHICANAVADIYFHIMNLVYTPHASPGAITELDDNESHHLQVLRMKVGEDLQAFDGVGGLYTATVHSMTKKGAIIAIGDLLRRDPAPAARLHIAIAPTKNMERLEWFVEKATEIGVHQITPIICRRSERRELRVDRLEKVALSAAKQSLHLHLPVIHEPVALDRFVKGVLADAAHKFIGYCEEHTHHLRDRFQAGESIIVMIGPEGDFTGEEIAAARLAGFMPVSLGTSRLRTETAGVMSAAIFDLKNVK